MRAGVQARRELERHCGLPADVSSLAAGCGLPAADRRGAEVARQAARVARRNRESSHGEPAHGDGELADWHQDRECGAGQPSVSA